MKITLVRWLNDQTRYIEASGTSSETKPTEKVATGSIFTEVDTGNISLYNEDSGEWVPQFSLQE